MCSGQCMIKSPHNLCIGYHENKYYEIKYRWSRHSWVISLSQSTYLLFIYQINLFNSKNLTPMCFNVLSYKYLTGLYFIFIVNPFRKIFQTFNSNKKKTLTFLLIFPKNDWFKVSRRIHNISRHWYGKFTFFF